MNTLTPQGCMYARWVFLLALVMKMKMDIDMMNSRMRNGASSKCLRAIAALDALRYLTLLTLVLCGLLRF